MSIKLTVLSGPSKGAIYPLQEGENQIGRSEDNAIVLAHSQVSKRHCVISISNNTVELLDAGSSNGTYVNGTLVKKKKLVPNDQITIGPFNLKISADAPMQTGATGATGVLGKPVSGLDLSGGNDMPGIQMPNTTEAMDQAVNRVEDVKAQEKSLFAKYKRKFDDIVLPVVYEFLEKYEWQSVIGGLFGVYMLFFISFSLYPLLKSNQESVINESKLKARYIVDQLVKQNTIHIIEDKETRLTTEIAEDDPDVIEAVITNMEGRILAPLDRLNATYGNPYATQHRNRIRSRDIRQWGLHVKRTDNYFVLSQPIFAGHPREPGRSVPMAIAVVRYSIKRNDLDLAVIGAIFGESVFVAGILAIIFIYLMYQVTRQPLKVLNDDIDEVLKGNAGEVEKRFQFPMMDELIDTINAALSRIPAEAGEEGDVVAASETETRIVENMFGTIKNMAMISAYSVMILDSEQRIQLINPRFEELTGIHEAEAIGDLVNNVSRDDAFPSLISDLVKNAALMGDEGASEDYEFNNGLHKVHCYAVQTLPNTVDYYIIYTEKLEDFD